MGEHSSIGTRDSWERGEYAGQDAILWNVLFGVVVAAAGVTVVGSLLLVVGIIVDNDMNGRERGKMVV